MLPCSHHAQVLCDLDDADIFAVDRWGFRAIHWACFLPPGVPREAGDDPRCGVACRPGVDGRMHVFVWWTSCDLAGQIERLKEEGPPDRAVRFCVCCHVCIYARMDGSMEAWMHGCMDVDA